MCEVFSPPRVGLEAVKIGLMVGGAMDLTTGWDFTKDEDRRRAEEYVDREQPLVLIGSPPCVAFSQLQSLIPNSDNKAKQLAEGIRHMEFVTRFYKKQIEAGRLFVHENLAHAKSWALPCIKKMLREVGVDVAEADNCMFGLKTWGKHRSPLVLAKKPTRFMTACAPDLGSTVNQIISPRYLPSRHAHDVGPDARQFRTFTLKTYPALFCEIMAAIVIDVSLAVWVPNSFNQCDLDWAIATLERAYRC